MENEKLLDSERKLAAFEQKLTRFKEQTLNASQKSVLVHADEIRTQLQINAGLERELQLKALRQRFLLTRILKLQNVPHSCSRKPKIKFCK
ncbi:hypothetical protein ARAF_0470 [Arsenophonus endosymbiont of Aleurodicus floccissimus]|nr:hypothetical protein [Arsenophonus endosymbiont of Aleurodicus floccissimus]SPP31346.1 hypothetical protein ARAF_0470 [Arsenophonus endosymbiont of Aleurodicus floccissimus]